MRLSAKTLVSVTILLATGGGACAHRAAATSIGPGRIVCNATFCELGIGDYPRQRYRVIASALPEAETPRLWTCTGVSKPCIVTVDGIEQGDKMKIMATRIAWQD
jgi:hypothetical protein